MRIVPQTSLLPVNERDSFIGKVVSGPVKLVSYIAQKFFSLLRFIFCLGCIFPAGKVQKAPPPKASKAPPPASPPAPPAVPLVVTGIRTENSTRYEATRNLPGEGKVQQGPAIHVPLPGPFHGDVMFPEVKDSGDVRAPIDPQVTKAILAQAGYKKLGVKTLGFAWFFANEFVEMEKSDRTVAFNPFGTDIVPVVIETARNFADAQRHETVAVMEKLQFLSEEEARQLRTDTSGENKLTLSNLLTKMKELGADEQVALAKEGVQIELHLALLRIQETTGGPKAEGQASGAFDILFEDILTLMKCMKPIAKNDVLVDGDLVFDMGKANQYKLDPPVVFMVRTSDNQEEPGTSGE